jgi:hypothetical protein
MAEQCLDWKSSRWHWKVQVPVRQRNTAKSARIAVTPWVLGPEAKTSKNPISGYTPATMSNISPELEALVRTFVSRLVAAIEADVGNRIQGVVAAALGSSGGTVPSRSVGRPALVGSSPGRPRRVSRELAAARKLQSQYLGALRGLKPADHARVKALAHEKGLPAAIKLARSLKR